MPPKIKSPHFKLGGNLHEPNSELIVFSLNKIVNNETYGLKFQCGDICYSLELVKLLKYLSDKTWSEIYSQRRNINYGHEHLAIKEIKDKNIREWLQNHSINKDKCDIFRFGNQKLRACGFRNKNIFYLVCIDYNFNLYNHGTY